MSYPGPHALPTALRSLRIAIVHYWLIEMRGGEKIIEALCILFPDAVIFTNIYEPEKISETIRRHEVRTGFVDRLPRAGKHVAAYLPLMPLALESMDFTGFDLVISCESGPAKGVVLPPDIPHLCICCSPMRYIWGMQKEYSQDFGKLGRAIFALVAHHLRIWDVTTAIRVDKFACISSLSARRVKRYYGRDSDIVHPPIDHPAFHAAGRRQDYFLFVGQLVPYKRAAVAIEACNRLGRRLVVIGDGEQSSQLKKLAGSTVEMVGWQPDAVLRDHYACCKALIFPGEEDFGLVPVEAMASGAPVLALRRGGALDTIIDGVTGLFFDESSPEAVVDVIGRFESSSGSFDPLRIREHARKFDRPIFNTRIVELIEALLAEKLERDAAI